MLYGLSLFKGDKVLQTFLTATKRTFNEPTQSAEPVLLFKEIAFAKQVIQIQHVYFYNTVVDRVIEGKNRNIFFFKYDYDMEESRKSLHILANSFVHYYWSNIMYSYPLDFLILCWLKPDLSCGHCFDVLYRLIPSFYNNFVNTDFFL